MKAKELFNKLDTDFIKPNMEDMWVEMMQPIGEFLTENFKQRAMGLVCDHTEEIEQVFTAVFANDKVIRAVLDKGVKNALLFVHHPMDWRLDKAPDIFKNMEPELIKKLKENKISVYCLHVPLDDFGEFSTSGMLAKALDLKPFDTFAPYHGAMAGLFCKTECKTLTELKDKFESAVGHKVRVYPYGDEELNGKVAVIAGGGLTEDTDAIVKSGANVFVSGITNCNDYSKDAHELLKVNKVSVIGGTHYSTEKFSMIAMCDYFKKLGLKAEFVKDDPLMVDI